MVLLPLGVRASKELAFGLIDPPIIEPYAIVLDLEELEGILFGRHPVLDADGIQEPPHQGVRSTTIVCCVF